MIHAKIEELKILTQTEKEEIKQRQRQVAKHEQVILALQNLLTPTNTGRRPGKEPAGDQIQKVKKESVIAALSNMRLCDPCSPAPFFRQAKSYYYESDDKDGLLLDIIISKLPEPMVWYIRKQKQSKYPNESMTLGKLELLATEYRKYLCIQKKEQTYIQKLRKSQWGQRYTLFVLRRFSSMWFGSLVFFLSLWC